MKSDWNVVCIVSVWLFILDFIHKFHVFKYIFFSVCEICLNHVASVYCKTCSKKVMCSTCDYNWHQHPRRQHNENERMKLNGNRLQEQLPKIDHQGEYGVSEVSDR